MVPEENRMLVTSYASAMWGWNVASLGTLARKCCQDTSPGLNFTWRQSPIAISSMLHLSLPQSTQ